MRGNIRKFLGVAVTLLFFNFLLFNLLSTNVQAVTFEPPTQNENLVDLAKGILKWLIIIVLPIAVAAIIYGGAILLFSQGKPELVSRGKKTITYAIIGLVVILIGQGFFTLIKSILDLRN